MFFLSDILLCRICIVFFGNSREHLGSSGLWLRFYIPLSLRSYDAFTLLYFSWFGFAQPSLIFGY